MNVGCRLRFWNKQCVIYVFQWQRVQNIMCIASRFVRAMILFLCLPETLGLSDDEGLGLGPLLLNDRKRCWQNSSGSSLSKNVCIKTLKPSKSISYEETEAKHDLYYLSQRRWARVMNERWAEVSSPRGLKGFKETQPIFKMYFYFSPLGKSAVIHNMSQNSCWKDFLTSWNEKWKMKNVFFSLSEQCGRGLSCAFISDN